MPIEAGLHSLFPRHQHIIDYLGFHVNKRYRMVRLYTAYAELSDLSSLVTNHMDMRKLVDDEGHPLQAPPIPTVAVLFIFEALTSGVCLMAHGAVPNDEGSFPGRRIPLWNHDIIHRDIKAQNYFLSASTSSIIWPKLPIAALGDFGNSVDAADPAYNGYSMEAGTKTWMAPEQLNTAPARYAVTSVTNVYQIGLVMLQLILLESPRFQTDLAAGRQGAIFVRTPPPMYPKELADLAWSCIAIDPDNRPRPIDLYVSIRDLAKQYPEGSDSQIPWREYTCI
jgi:serine/threonine protein kinase